MSVPATPRPFCPPPFAVSGEPVGFWSQIPFDNEQAQPASGVDWPPFKKPRNSEDIPSNSFSNPPANPRMQPPPALNPPLTKGTSRMFFKTRPCAKFIAGACPYGDNCNFAHGPDDMRKPPPNWQEILAARAREEERAAGLWDEDQRIITRLKLCKKFCNGEECPYGDRCNFLHEDPSKFRDDPGRFRESSAISIGITETSPGSNGSGSDHQQESNGVVNSGSDANRINQKPAYWKTRICSKWETTGNCLFGDKCHFAHGQAELQKYGGHTEAESVTVCIAPIKPLMNSSNDVLPINTGVGTCKQQVHGKKCLLNWRAEKISRIYADWIDDVPLVRNSPSKVES
ncbi:zinc finger CCCH domain-containing protein 39 [Macadamia integrifolia]|uniref:zinc finger CCCH domain-containing protein 39 n=1 Tax=Macadamia integrifolia TaxID=60698 RepID=UPI001C4F5393|nr:zinc finger CCCH domain-containing protein 39 [Macadamia integrifolia]